MKRSKAKAVIPAKAGIQRARKIGCAGLDSRLRGNDVIAVLLFVLVLRASPLLASSQDTPEDKLLSRGFEAYMDGRDRAALTYFQEVIHMNPQNTAAQMAQKKVQIRLKKAADEEKVKAQRLAEAKLREGRELMKTKDVVSAIDAYHAAMDAVPGYKKADKELKKVQKEMQSILDRKRFSLSLWAFARGVLAYLDRDWAKAYRIWSQRSEMEPQNVALKNAKDRAENKFVQLMLSEREEFLRRGAREFYRQGLYQEAKSSWEKVVAMRDGDLEGMEGMARSEEAILRIQGKNRSKQSYDLLEEGLSLYSKEDFSKAREVFTELVQMDPEFKSGQEYLNKITKRLSEQQYRPLTSAKSAQGWREMRPSNSGSETVEVPTNLENIEERRKELESQLKRDPANIRVQQELDRMKITQDEESERIYKDGLIAYSQGNRIVAINKWKQVLVLNPDHKKAAAALRKARAEQERTTETEERPQ